MNVATDQQAWDIQHHLDTQGLICPEPVMLLHKSIRQAEAGELIEVLATDPATTRDIPNFCRHLGHTLLANGVLSDTQQELPANANSNQHDDDDNGNLVYRYVIQKKAV